MGDQQKIWKEHMEKLTNLGNEWSDSTDANKVEDVVRRIEVEEMRCAMNLMKNGKTIGPCGAALEMFKAGGDKCFKYLPRYLMTSCSRISYWKNVC